MQGITSAVERANPKASVVYDAAGTSTTATSPAVLSAQTQADIKSADLVIVFVGTDSAVAGEGHDRASLAMPGNYDSLINQVNALGNHKMALVVQSDGPVTIDDVQGDFPAVVFSGYNGESQGSALADVLFGKKNPSGHLNFTWYKDDSQLPDMSNYGLTPSQTGGLGRTYMYFTGKPTYPFGHGLSYTRFAYSHLQVGPRSTTPDGTVNVHFDVTNTGTTPGATVAQLYVAPAFGVAGIQLPKQRLEGFEKTGRLRPGQTQRISLPVKLSALALWDQARLKSVVYDGSYRFEVGADAGHVTDAGSVAVHGSWTPRVQTVTVQPDQVMFTPGETLDLTGKNPWIKDDTDPALQQPHATADNIVEAANSDGSFVDLTHAHVSYASTNRNVATVSKAGMLEAVAAGVATIKATVNGVTGSTVVVVQQPFTLSSPTVVLPGSTITATTTLPNPGNKPLTSVDMTLKAAKGWTVKATSASSFSTVAAGQTARTTWSITVPSGTSPASYRLTGGATFNDANGRGRANAPAQVSVPYASFDAAFDNPGISDDSNPSAGNLDGGGFSYSAQTLAAVGLTPGAAVSHDGLAFTWPDAAPGTPDNVVAAGQTVPLSGSGTTLGFLGTGDYGTATGTGTITYTDGTTQSFTLGFPDWYANLAGPGGDILATVPYINKAGGKATQQVSIYYDSVPLQSGKTVQYVTLPDFSQGVTSGQTAMHVFAMAIK